MHARVSESLDGGDAHAELAARVSRAASSDGAHATIVPGLSVVRASGPSQPLPSLYDPSLCIVVQGRKLAILANETYVYDALNYLQRISRAVHLLRRRYTEPLRVNELAAAAHMSASSFHHRFKQVTSLSPLQFQKQLRLHEARRLMLSEDLDASAAAHRVGYESASQFSREYRRFFGAPPRREVEALRA